MKKVLIGLSKFIFVVLSGVYVVSCANPLMQEDYENKEITQQNFCAINNLYPCFGILISQERIEKFYNDYKKNMTFSKCKTVQAEQKYMVIECFVEEEYYLQKKTKKNWFEIRITDKKEKNKYGNELQIVEIKQTSETGQTEKNEVVLAEGNDSLIFKPVRWFYKIFPSLYEVPQHRFVGKFFSDSWYEPLKNSSGYSFEIGIDYLVITKKAANDYAFYKNCKILKNKEKYMEIVCRTHQSGDVNAWEAEEKNRFEFRVTNDIADGLYKENLRVIEIKQRDEKGKAKVYHVGVNNNVVDTFLPDNRFYKIFPSLYEVPQDYFVDKRFNQKLRPLSRYAREYTLSPTKVIGYYQEQLKYPGRYELYTGCKLLANKEGYLVYKCQKRSEYCESIKACEETQENKIEYLEFYIGRFDRYQRGCERIISLLKYNKLYGEVQSGGGYLCIPDLSEEGEK